VTILARTATSGLGSHTSATKTGVWRKLGGFASTPHVLALADQVIVSGTSFLMTMAVGRSTSPSELGAYSVGMSLLTSMVAVQESLICLPYTMQTRRSDQMEPERLGGSLTQSFVLSTAEAMAFGRVTALRAAHEREKA
jgi:hypothetical protein